MTIQLDILTPKSEIDVLREEIQQLRESNHKVRKALFKRNADLTKMFLDIHEEHQELKSMVMAQYKTEFGNKTLEFKLENTG